MGDSDWFCRQMPAFGCASRSFYVMLIAVPLRQEKREAAITLSDSEVPWRSTFLL